MDGYLEKNRLSSLYILYT